MTVLFYNLESSAKGLLRDREGMEFGVRKTNGARRRNK